MTNGTFKMICKIFCIIQAIAAFSMAIFGGKVAKKIGQLWCALIALDTGRSSWVALDYGFKAEDLEDDLPLGESKKRT